MVRLLFDFYPHIRLCAIIQPMEPLAAASLARQHLARWYQSVFGRMKPQA